MGQGFAGGVNWVTWLKPLVLVHLRLYGTCEPTSRQK